MPVRRIKADVCIAGGGLAGLVAARRLVQGGRSVQILEARARLGGRVWTKRSDAGVPVDMGATFVGPNHDRLRALIKELGGELHATYTAGDTILIKKAKPHRYRGDVPHINPIALLSAGQAIYRLNAMSKKVPVDQPWNATRASDWDAQTVRGWLSRVNVPTVRARQLIESTVRALFACDLSEVSLLNLLYLIRSAGGLEELMTVEGGYQQDQFVGGAQRLIDSMASDLGGAISFESPVQAIVEGSGPVEVHTPRAIVTAGHAIVAIPPALAGHIHFHPPLPADHALLRHQLPAGTEVKMVAIYDEPFWRQAGLSGASVDLDAEYEVTLDTSPASGEVGVMAAYAAGPRARRLAAMSAADRRKSGLDTLQARFGADAAHPIEILEQNWAEEEWTRGCSMAHFGPGVLTQYGHLLRQPVGSIHWAGTETAGTSHGAMDGAVRSGERAADEILQASN